MEQLSENRYSGMWWLPINPEEKIYGTLTYQYGERATLELIDTFKSITKQKGELIELPIIHGETDRLSRITLSDCFVSMYRTQREKEGKLRPRPLEIKAYTVAIGNWFDTNPLQFNYYLVRTNRLEQWVRLSGLRERLNPITSQTSTTRLTFKNLDPIELYKDSQVSISLVFRNYRDVGFGRFKGTIEQRTYLRFDFAEITDIDVASDSIRKVLLLTSFGMDSPIEVISISGILDPEPNVKNSLLRKSARISTTKFVAPKTKSNSILDKMLFAFPDIRADISQALKNWLDKFEKLEPIIGLHHGLKLSPELFFEVQVLSLSQALETFHRRLIGGAFNDKKFYRNNILPLIEIKDGMSEEQRSAIKERLIHGYEYPFRTRLHDLLNRLPTEIVEKYLTADRDEFVKGTVRLRNYYTHYDEPKEPDIAHNNWGAFLPQRLKLLLEFNILLELGIQLTTVNLLIKAHYDGKLPSLIRQFPKS